MVRGWGCPRPQSRYSLFCPRAALGGRADTARANQERAPRSRRPRDLEAGVSPRTSLAVVAMASSVPVAPLPSSCNTSMLRLQSPADASQFPPVPTTWQSENCCADQREAGTESPHQDMCLENLSARGEARRECQVLGSPASWGLSFSSVTAGHCMPMALQIKTVHHLHSWLGASLLAVKARNPFLLRGASGAPADHRVTPEAQKRRSLSLMPKRGRRVHS